MKTLLKSLKITLAFCVFFSVFYILILWVFAQVAGPNKGKCRRKRYESDGESSCRQSCLRK